MGTLYEQKVCGGMSCYIKIITFKEYRHTGAVVLSEWYKPIISLLIYLNALCVVVRYGVFKKRLRIQNSIAG